MPSAGWRDRAESKEMINRPVAAWMRKEDDQLRAAVASGEAVVEISKRLCRSEKAIRHRAQTLGIMLPSRQWFGSPRRLVELGLDLPVASGVWRGAIDGRFEETPA